MYVALALVSVLKVEVLTLVLALQVTVFVLALALRFEQLMSIKVTMHYTHLANQTHHLPEVTSSIRQGRYKVLNPFYLPITTSRRSSLLTNQTQHLYIDRDAIMLSGAGTDAFTSVETASWCLISIVDAKG